MVAIEIVSQQPLQLKLFKHCQPTQYFSILPCALSPLLRRKTSFLKPAMVNPLVKLLPLWVLASLQLSGSSKTSFPTISHLILVVLPSSLPPLNVLSLHKSPQERLPMLSRPQSISIPSSPTLSPHKLCVE